MPALSLAALLLGAPGCSGADPVASPDPTPTPTPMVTAPAAPLSGPARPVRVLVAGRDGEFPTTDLHHTTLHALDGELTTGWSGGGVGRFEFAELELTSISLVPALATTPSDWAAARKVSRVRWRPLLVGSDAGAASAPWFQVDLATDALSVDAPWVSIPVPHGLGHVVGVEVEPMAGAPEGDAPLVVAEIRFVGRSVTPDNAARSAGWTASASLDPSGPFRAGAWDAVDPSRCSAWANGVEQRGTELCHIERGERGALSLTIGTPGTFEHTFAITPVGGCLALIDGMPFTRCRAPGTGPLVGAVPLPEYAAEKTGRKEE